MATFGAFYPYATAGYTVTGTAQNVVVPSDEIWEVHIVESFGSPQDSQFGDTAAFTAQASNGSNTCSVANTYARNNEFSPWEFSKSLSTPDRIIAKGSQTLTMSATVTQGTFTSRTARFNVTKFKRAI